MTFAKGLKRFGWWEKFKEEKFEDIHNFLRHVALYVGLIVYTAFGGLIFLALEHPYEKMYLQELQDLVLLERLNLKNMIYNLTSNLKDEDLDILYDYANMERRFANATDEESIRKFYMLATNDLSYATPALSQVRTGSKSVDAVIEKLDNALLSYEETLSNATGQGIDVASKEIDYKWTYVSSVFFTSTVITTVGYGNIAPVTVGGRSFCIVFASIGIPFTLTVLADVGVIFATIVTTVGAKGKTIITPIARWIKTQIKMLKRKRRRRARQRKSKSIVITASQEEDGEVMEEDDEGGGDTEDNDEELDDDDETESENSEEGDKIEGGIWANIMMGLLAIAALCLFMSCGSFVFTRFEAEWNFFDAFYYCFITMTTIGFGDMVPTISEGKASYMMFCMTFTIFGLAFFSTIIELVRRQYQESWRKMQELRAQIQAQLKLAEHLRKMAEEGKDVEGMEVDMDTLRKNMKRYGMDLKDLDWLDAERRRKVKAVTIFFYETSL